MRVALYARYSSDRQNERSIEDQLAVCAARAAERGWSVVATFSDAAISGSAMANRPGLNAAVAAAASGAFDVLMAEDEDRLARNLEHQAHVFNRLKALGVDIATMSSAGITIIDVGLRGLMAELFLENLSAKTRRGMHSNAEKGLATGSRLYGYKTQPGGHIEIVEAEAAVIRDIFAMVVAGRTPREVAARLNIDGVPGPRGGLWNHSSVNGSRQRGNGILHTELYAGVKVWNRFDMSRDRSTGKRISRARPREEWKRVEVPHLAIVDRATWDAAQARLAGRGDRMPQRQRKRARWLLSGLIRCGACGSTYVSSGANRLVCAGNAEKGPAHCTNRRSVRRDEVVDRTLRGLRERLMQPDAVAQAVRDYHAAEDAQRAVQTNQRAPLERRLQDSARAIDRIVDAIARGLASPAMEARLMALEAERRDLEEKILAIDRDAGPRLVRLHPKAGEIYAAMVGGLQASLHTVGDAPTDAEQELLDSVRDLIDKVVLTPRSQQWGGPYDLVLHGRLAAFMQGDQTENELGSALVAGGRIELPTCGL